MENEKRIKTILWAVVVLFQSSHLLWAKEETPLKTVPDFSLTELSGKKVQLSALDHKLVLINFWASYCGPCLEELPSIIELWKAYGNKGLSVVAINKDEDPKAGLKAVSKKVKFPFEVYTDPEDQLSELFRATAFPLTIILNKKNKVLLHFTGKRNWNSPEVLREIEKWLADSSN